MYAYNSTIKIRPKGGCNHPTCGETCRRPVQPKKNNIQKKYKSMFDQELERWFEHRMKTCEPRCQNCGVSAPWVTKEPYLQLWKAAQAHILPKRNFKSIASHPLNGLVMFAGYSGVCSCHDDFDSNWRKASQMPIWETVKERFKILYPFIAQEELRFIPHELLVTL